MAGAFLAMFIHNAKLHVTPHDERFSIGILQCVCIFKDNNTFLACFEEGLLPPLRNPADVEGAHGQLRSRLTDGLRRDDTHRFTNIDDCPTCKVTTITHRTHAFFGLTGKRASNPCRLKAGGLHRICHQFVDQIPFRDDHFVSSWAQNIFGSDPTENTFGKRRYNLSITDRGLGKDCTFRTTIAQSDNTILCDIHQTAGEVTRVCSFQSRIRKTFTRPVCRVEILKHRQTFFKVRNNRGFDDVTVWLGHKATHTAQLFHLRDRAPRA